jgi:hypothetical protein
MNNSTTTTKPIRGYKVFNSDWTCRGFQFEVGQTYSLPEGQEPIPCRQGFHFCEIAADCFNYYAFDSSNKVAVVEAIGVVVINGDKSCTNVIKVIEEVSWERLLALVNTGKGNSGNLNSGNRNSGDQNSGNWNSGDRNSGNWNSGDRNSGDWNSGNWNSGDQNSGNQNSGNRNSGDRNSGNRNSGYWNSGNWNSGNWNSGDLNSTTPSTIRVFNKEIDTSVWSDATIPNFFYFDINRFVFEYEMSKEEKKQNKGWKMAGGYLKTMDYKEAWQESYRRASQEDRELVKKLPNFDADVFFEITGIRVE